MLLWMREGNYIYRVSCIFKMIPLCIVFLMPYLKPCYLTLNRHICGMQVVVCCGVWWTDSPGKAFLYYSTFSYTRFGADDHGSKADDRLLQYIPCGPLTTLAGISRLFARLQNTSGSGTFFHWLHRVLVDQRYCQELRVHVVRTAADLGVIMASLVMGNAGLSCFKDISLSLNTYHSSIPVKIIIAPAD